MGWTLFANPASGFGGGRLAAWLAPLLVLALWAAEAKAQSTVLVSTLGQPLNASVGVDTSDFAQRFTTGANVGGYTLASVELRLSAPPSMPGATVASAAPRVRVVGGAAAGSGSVEVASLTAETATIPVGDPATYTFTAPPNTALRPSTDYWLVIEAASSGGGSVAVALTASDAEDATSAPGWSIDDGRLTRAHDSTGDFSARGQTFMIRVNGSTRDNTAAAGAPEIAGTATVGRRLRASRGSVADHDGVSPPFSYQWIRVDGATETEISGATASSYLLDAADLGKQVKVRLSFTDDGGAMETRTSDAYPAMGTVQAAPMPGTPGAALVSNLGQSLDGIGGVDTLDIAQKFTTGANAGGYTLSRVDLRLVTSIGIGTDTAAPRVRVVGGAATGSDSVEVATLDAETPQLPVDAQSTYAFAAPESTALRPETDYWVVVEAASSGGGDVHLGATLSDAEDAGSAAGWSIDDRGFARSHGSTGAFFGNDAALMIRVNGGNRANTPATGTPEIAGTATEGARLQAGQGSVADDDGVPSSFGYQWIRVDAGTETEIAGATASSYLLDAADVGTQVKVKLSFTDDFGTAETRTSEAFPPTGTVASAPQPDTPGAALVSNLGQLLDGTSPLASQDLAQKFTTGANVGGYTLASVELRLEAITADGGDSAAPRVRVVGGAAAGSGSVEVASLTAETTTIPLGAAANYTFTATANVALRPSTPYWLVVEAASSGGGDVKVGGTDSDAEDAGSAAGWSIDDQLLTRADESTGAFSGYEGSLMIRVNGDNRANSPATGTPVIAGTATEGERLQASQGSVMDPDGVPPPFGYQWIRVDGGTDTEISGATSSSYLLDAADVGKRVKVALSFTDDEGAAETRLSDAYPPDGRVRSAPPPGSGGAALVSNLGQTGSGGREIAGFDLAQKFTTGANSAGYALTGVDIRLLTLPGPESDAPRVRVVRRAATGSGPDVVARLAAETSPIPAAAQAAYTFTASAGILLRPSTDYWVVVEAAPGGGGDITVATALSDEEDAGAAAGWSIDDRGLERSRGSTGDFAAVEESLMIRIGGRAVVAAAPVAAPTAADGSVRTRPDTAYAFEADDFGFAGAPGRGLASVRIETLPEPGKGRLTLGGDAVAAGQPIARSDIDAGNLEYAPPAGAAGEDFASFAFRVNDGTADSADAYTMTIHVETVHVVDPAGERALGAWLPRFGRAVADQVLGAMEGRMRAAPRPGAEVSLGGQRIGLSAPAGGGVARGLGPEPAPAGATRTMGGDALLLGSSFSLAGDAPGGGSLAFWGRGAASRFDGRAGGLAVDGAATGAMLGTDWRHGRWTAGLVLAHSLGEGGYRDGADEAARGTIEATLTGLYPWLRHALGERLEAWGAAGYGRGGLTLEPADGPAVDAELSLWMAAGGLRGTLLEPGGGLALTGRTDVMIAGASSGAAGSGSARLAAVDGEATRLRLGLEGALPVDLGEGAVLTPGFELGARHDGGDAETELGADIGASLAWTDAASGLAVELRARGLLAHEAAGFRERGLSGAVSWQPGAAGRGPLLSVTQSLGGASSGGAGALLGRTTLEGLGGQGGGELRSRRLEARLGYGFAALGDRFTATPEAGLALSDAGRQYSIGWRLAHRPGPGPGTAELALEARRSESADATPVHHARARLTARF